MRRSVGPVPVVWLALVLPGAALMVATVRGPLSEPTWTSPTLAFWALLVITVLCAIGAVAVVALGWRRRLAEVAILGSMLLAVSVLPLVHGLTIPGVLFEENSATAVAALAAVPLAVVIALPLIFPEAGLSRALARRWRAWSVATMCASVAIAAFLFAAPNAVAAPHVGDPLTNLLVVVSLGGTLLLALRHLRLYRLGRRPASLVASAAFMYLGISTLVFLTEEPYSFAWWAAHVADAVGVFGGIFGLGIAHYRDRTLTATLAPVVNRDPLIALELGLTPVVHDFIAGLDRKDPVTRDHVVRVGELAMRSGARAGLEGARLRDVGLAALLHDVGKLAIPDEILKKPGKLTEEEFAVIEEHTVIGERLLAGEPLLAGAASLVRSHHERPDGGGYPDGLRGEQIPLEAMLIATCDAWDAMTGDRHYREGMSPERATAILRQGAGSQWDERCVELVLATLGAEQPVTEPAFDRLGRESAHGGESGQLPTGVCTDALPADLLESLGLDASPAG